VKALIPAAALLLALTACGGTGEASQVECDLEDQATYSADCGHWDDGTFIFWYWVVLGQTSYGPALTPPAGARTQRPVILPARPPVKTQPKPPAAVQPPKPPAAPPKAPPPARPPAPRGK
jgi:hypothetical protein